MERGSTVVQIRQLAEKNAELQDKCAKLEGDSLGGLFGGVFG